MYTCYWWMSIIYLLKTTYTIICRKNVNINILERIAISLHRARVSIIYLFETNHFVINGMYRWADEKCKTSSVTNIGDR